MDGESKPVSLNLMEFSNITPSFEEEPIESVGVHRCPSFLLKAFG
jgi:hypothetical protein